MIAKDNKFYMGLYRENFRNFPVPSHIAYGYQILLVTLSSGPSVRGVNYIPKVKLIAKDNKFYMGLYRENFRNFPVPSHIAYGYQILLVTFI